METPGLSSGQGLVFPKGTSSYSPDASAPVTWWKATQDNSSRRAIDITPSPNHFPVEEAHLNHETVLLRDQGWRTEERGCCYCIPSFSLCPSALDTDLCHFVRTMLRALKLIVLGGWAFDRLFFPTPVFASQRSLLRPRQRPFTPRDPCTCAP